MTPQDTSKREAALVMLRLGYASLSEVARLSDVDRQLVAYWAKADGIDVAENRETFLKSNWDKALAGMLRARRSRA